jgi:hypothetical protein
MQSLFRVWWLVLLGIAACLPTEQESESEDDSEEVAEVSQALASDAYYIPDDGPTAAPLAISWVTNIGASTPLSSVTFRVKNSGTANQTVTAEQLAHGLDHRSITKTIGTFTVPGGGEVQQTIATADVAMKSVSHSTQLAIQVRITHNGEPLTVISPPAFIHFNASYSQSYVYSYDAMATTHNGGQLVADGYALAGKIWYGGAYVDIVARRQAEAGTTPVEPTMGPIYTFSGGVGGGTSPQPGGWFTVCGGWRTRFVDASSGDYGTSPGEQNVVASYAKAEIRKTTVFPCGHMNPDLCSTQVWQGYLGSNGCVSFNPQLATKYQIKIFSDLKRTLGPNVWSSTINYFDNNKVNKGVRTFHRSFNTPPSTSGPQPNSVYFQPPYQLTQNVAANISRLLLQTDIPPNNANGDYSVQANIGCQYGAPDDPGIPSTDSCAWSDYIFIGPEQVPGTGIPGDIVWKNVIAHEIGHQVQRKLNGVPARLYRFKNGLPCDDYLTDSQCQADDVTIGASCRCEHIVSSNRLHCLQSRETMTATDAEGFGHFIAARIWNNANDGDCSFNYYKEFRELGGVVKLPPHKVDCQAATRWRDNQCFASDRGTEYDWLQFFWNLNTVGVNKIGLSAIGQFHINACNGYFCDNGPDAIAFSVNWPGLRDGALQYYGGNATDPKFLNFLAQSDALGVDETQ